MDIAISLQDFCVKNSFPITLSYRAVTKYVAEYVQANGRPEGKRVFSFQFQDKGFMVQNYGSKRALYIVTNQNQFRAYLAYWIGFENLLSKDTIYEVFKAAKTGRSNKPETVNRALKRVGVID